MRNFQVERETIAMLAEMYSNETSSLILNNEASRPFNVEKGVRQGGISSPTCFNFITETLTRRLHNKQNCGVKLYLYPHLVNHLLYADDLILFGTSPEHLRVLIHEVIVWAAEYQLVINEKKTEVIALNTSTNFSITVNGHRIYASNPTYLGFTLDRKLNGTAHLDERIRKGKQKMFATIASLARLPRLKMTIKSNIVRA